MLKDTFQRLQGKIAACTFNVCFPDGDTMTCGQGVPAFSLIFRREVGLEGAGLHLGLGEAYMRGDWELAGDWAEAVRVMAEVEKRLPARRASRFTAGLRRALPGGCSRQRKSIRRHYDLGDDFYSLWLDPGLNYSCAYFRHPQDTLAQAQEQKIDLCLRKLRLSPDLHLLHLGCGWGETAVRAAEQCGCRVLGIALSERQRAEAAGRAAKRAPGLVEIRLQGRRDLGDRQPFDRILSLDTFEHVGRRNMSRWFATVARLLKPGGLCLLQTLTKLKEGRSNDWTEKYIFPGGHIPSLREIVALSAEHGLHVQHVENLRPHYAKTVDAWYDNFSAPEAQAKMRAKFDEKFVRMWGLYLQTAAACLHAGILETHQLVLSKGLDRDLPFAGQGLTPAENCRTSAG